MAFDNNRDFGQIESDLQQAKHACALCGKNFIVTTSSPRMIAILESEGLKGYHSRLSPGQLSFKRPGYEFVEDYKICAKCKAMKPETLAMRRRIFESWLKDLRARHKRLIAAQNSADTGAHNRATSAEQERMAKDISRA